MWKKLMLPLHRQKRIQRLIRQAAGDGASERTPSEDERRLVRGILETLDHDSLSMLCEVTESRGAALGSCVVVPRREFVLRSLCATSVVLMCRYFRWPDVDHECRLRRLFACQCVDDVCRTCINPYHWSLVYTPDSRPSSVASAKRCSSPHDVRTSDASETTGPESETTVPESVTTAGTEQYGSTSLRDGGSCRTWCRIFYFERRRRVGQLGGWAAREPVQHVFYNVPHGDGLSISSVAEQNPQPEPDVLRTRPQIGTGLTLTLEPSGVWLYNRSERPLFVSAPSLEPADAVHRLPPGYSALVYVWPGERPRRPPDARRPASVTVSFVKGWGANYTRRSPADCPCWLEVCFSPPADRER